MSNNSIASLKFVLLSSCLSKGLYPVEIKKHKHFFHVYFKDEHKVIQEKRNLLQEAFHKFLPNRFYIILDWERNDSDTYDKPGGKAMDGKGIHSGLNVIDRETKMGSLYTFLFN